MEVRDRFGKRSILVLVLSFVLGFSMLGSVSYQLVFADAHVAGSSCDELPSHDHLRDALVAARSADNGGFDLDMWGTVVNRDGVVCAVAFTGNNRGDQWPGSRVISAQKANTANAFSLPGLALSTANIFSAVQPGGSLFGLQHSNPVNTDVAYQGDGEDFGTNDDPMVGERIGGVNVFGGGLGLYNSDGELIGGIGVSGDSSCADHGVSWRTRHGLGLDFVPAGVSGDDERPDNIVFDLADRTNPLSSESGWGHANCIDAETEIEIASNLPPVGQSIAFEAIDSACAEGNIVESDEEMMAGISELVFVQESSSRELMGVVTFLPDAFPESTWVAPGRGHNTPEGDFSVFHRGHGTGDFEGGVIMIHATAADESEELPCEPVGPVAHLQGVIILPEEE